jgi:hypothetical protein
MVKELPGYPSVISVETLMELDLPGTRRIQENLGECFEFLRVFLTAKTIE